MLGRIRVQRVVPYRERAFGKTYFIFHRYRYVLLCVSARLDRYAEIPFFFQNILAHPFYNPVAVVCVGYVYWETGTQGLGPLTNSTGKLI